MKLYQTLLYETDQQIATLTLNRPDQRNRLNQTMMAELKDAFLRLDQEEQVKIVILKAHGNYFCDGLDPYFVQQIQEYTFDQHVADSTFLAEIFMTIYRSTKVLISQVEGEANGIGAALLMVSDLVWATSKASISFNEVKYGMIPAIAINFLLRKTGELRTKELLLSGESIPPSLAEAYHLINGTVQGDIQTFVKQKAFQMAQQNSGASMQLIKKMVADIQEFPLERAMSFSAKMNAYARTTAEGKIGLAKMGNSD
ncbi:MAG: enoyl-CoA hydratase/isomerase family protein [Bacteroidota bacterium]